MAKRVFRPYEPARPLPLPPDLRQWLPADHMVYLLSDLVDHLDLSPITSVYDQGDGGGNPPYHPVLLTKLLFYAYSQGVVSSRAIAAKTYEDVAFRVLTADQHPDFRTISDFRERHLQALLPLFQQVVRLAGRLGLVTLEHVAQDGSKILANASKHRAMSYARLQQAEARLGREIQALLAAARQADAAKDAAQRNFTDPDSRIMKNADKAFVQAYNGQLAVDASPHQLIVGCAVTNQAADAPHLEPMVEQVRAVTGGTPQEWSSDTGFFSAHNLRVLAEAGIAAFIPPERQPHSTPALPTGVAQVLAAAGVGPPDAVEAASAAAAHAEMRATLATDAGRAAYAKRKQTVEPVFGQLKERRGLRRFLLRGLAKVSGEWALWCLTHNLAKLVHALRTAAGLRQRLTMA